MRVTPPKSLKLDRQELLRDVRERLAERLPQYAGDEHDPTDPAWLLLEQAAWLVELLSSQIDEYPYSVLQQVIHVIGGELLPARPAVGVVVARVGQQGVLAPNPRQPDRTRFFTPQNEKADNIEFVPLDDAVFLGHGAFTSIVDWTGLELVLASDDRPEDPGSMPGKVLWHRPRQRSILFQHEQIEFTVATNRPEDTVKEFESAIELFDKRRIGWLSLEVEPRGKDRVKLTAKLDLARPFAETVPGGFTAGGDIDADWGVLDDSTWTPTVRVRQHPLLPRGLRGSRPMPGMEEGRIVFPDVPENFPVAQLLERSAAPIPGDVVDAIWQTLGNLNTRIGSLRPKIERKFPLAVESDREPSWVDEALMSGVWDVMVRGGARTVAHLDGLQGLSPAKPVRVAVVRSAEEADLDLEVFQVTNEGQVPRSSLEYRVAWRLPGVLEGVGGKPVEVVALDVKASAETAGILLAYRGESHVYLHNTMLVANTPAVRDGRRTVVQRNVPEPLSLLFEDVVTPEVIEQVLDDPIPDSAARLLRKLRLAHFEVTEQPPVENWTGLQVDASAGTVVVNAPDAGGRKREFRPGAEIELEWYRRTDGKWGNVEAGAISLSEQPPSSVPSIMEVNNPLGTVFGVDREEPRAAVDRLFAPSGGSGLPVLPSDFEKLFRQALGRRAEGWVIRVWTYAERSLVSNALWPFPRGAAADDEETARLRDELLHAGPEALLVIIGPEDGEMTPLEFQSARAIIQKRIERLHERIPALKRAVVGRFHPLELRVTEARTVVTPCFDTTGLQGQLADGRGRNAKPPVDTLLLNAAVTKVTEATGRWA